LIAQIWFKVNNLFWPPRGTDHVLKW